MNEYLTEISLGIFLNEFISSDWTHDKTVPYSSDVSRCRPDYRSEELKIIVEFDGYQHYTQASTIIRDELKDKIYIDMGYSVIRIPYFIQLDITTIKLLFNIDVVDNFNNFQHGFIDQKSVKPADFCGLGLKRFFKELEIFDKEMIIKNTNAANPSVDTRVLWPQNLF